MQGSITTSSDQSAAASCAPHAKAALDPEQSRRAIYIDFEGRVRRPPVLLGALYMTGRNFDQKVIRNYIVDDRFHPLAETYEILGGAEFPPPRCTTLSAACRELLRQARKQDRLIVSWSQHDGKIMRDATPDEELESVFDDRYRDGKATAKRWFQQFHSATDLPRGRGNTRHLLANYMELIDYELPDPRFGQKKTHSNLGRVEQAFANGTAEVAFSDRQHTAWRDVVGHNYFDCDALREIVTTAAHTL